MSVWNNIRSVAKYERKLLLRTWFYRVFLVLSVLILALFNFAALLSDDGYWLMKSLPSNIPYVNLLLSWKFRTSISIPATWLKASGVL